LCGDDVRPGRGRGDRDRRAEAAGRGGLGTPGTVPLSHRSVTVSPAYKPLPVTVTFVPAGPLAGCTGNQTPLLKNSAAGSAGWLSHEPHPPAASTVPSGSSTAAASCLVAVIEPVAVQAFVAGLYNWAG
jgi:hypothetical protein